MPRRTPLMRCVESSFEYFLCVDSSFQYFLWEPKKTDTARLIGNCLFVGPAGRREAALQVVVVGVRNVDAEWSDRSIAGFACGERRCRRADSGRFEWIHSYSSNT